MKTIYIFEKPDGSRIGVQLDSDKEADQYAAQNNYKRISR